MTAGPNSLEVNTTRGGGSSNFYAGDGYGEFGFRFCEGCDRWICERNRYNGYQGWFKDAPTYDDDEYEGQICVACYQSSVLTNGLPRSAFEPDAKGQFVMAGDFFDADDLEKAGYAEVPDFHRVKITGATAEQYCRHAQSLLDDGARVITTYRSLSILGDEGYVSMWSTKRKRAKI
jgi:hypothetical protein